MILPLYLGNANHKYHNSRSSRSFPTHIHAYIFSHKRQRIRPSNKQENVNHGPKPAEAALEATLMKPMPPQTHDRT